MICTQVKHIIENAVQADLIVLVTSFCPEEITTQIEIESLKKVQNGKIENVAGLL
jgi:hypothetical protein